MGLRESEGDGVWRINLAKLCQCTRIPSSVAILLSTPSLMIHINLFQNRVHCLQKSRPWRNIYHKLNHFSEFAVVFEGSLIDCGVCDKIIQLSVSHIAVKEFWPTLMLQFIEVAGICLKSHHIISSGSRCALRLGHCDTWICRFSAALGIIVLLHFPISVKL